MSDNNFASTPYPTYSLGGDDDSVQQAVLTSHTGASIERNQDSQFAALSRQALQGKVSDSRRESVETKFELANQVKDSEIRNSDRFSELKDLIHAQAARDLAEARADLRQARADARQDKLESMLVQLIAKVS